MSSGVNVKWQHKAVSLCHYSVMWKPCKWGTTAAKDMIATCESVLTQICKSSSVLQTVIEEVLTFVYRFWMQYCYFPEKMYFSLGSGKLMLQILFLLLMLI